jgi:hypothetical protein
VALAVYLAARLADDTLPERGVSAEARTERAAHAKNWLSSMALTVPVRSSLARLIEATASGPRATAAALPAAIAAATSHLDTGARAELDRLTTALGNS